MIFTGWDGQSCAAAVVGGAVARSVAPARTATSTWRRCIFLSSRFFDDSREPAAAQILPLGATGVSGECLHELIAVWRGVESHDCIDDAVALAGRERVLGEAGKLFRDPASVQP